MTGFLCILSFCDMESAIGSGEQSQACVTWVSHLPTSESFPFTLMGLGGREGGCWLNRTIPFFVLLALKCRFVCFGPNQVQWISCEVDPKPWDLTVLLLSRDTCGGVPYGIPLQKYPAQLDIKLLQISVGFSFTFTGSVLQVGRQEPAGVYGLPQSWCVSFFWWKLSK